MQYLGVDTWEEVLRFFAQGGKFAGEWGWLEAMRAADLGENIYFTAGMAALLQNGISSYSRFASSDALANASSFVGHFVEANGEILFVNNENQGVVAPAQVLQHATHEGYTVTHPLEKGLERIRRNYIKRNQIYEHWRANLHNAHGDPVSLWHYADTAGIAMGTGALGIAKISLGIGLCDTGIGCIGGGLLIANGGASLTASGMLFYALFVELEEEHVIERTP